MRVWAMVGWLVLASALGIGVVGCSGSGTGSGGSGIDPEQASALFGPGSKDGGGTLSGETGRWSIVLAAFAGPDREVQAEQGVLRARGVSGLSDAFVEHRGPRSIVAVGRYADPLSREAQSRLRSVRELEADGSRVAPFAFMMPPENEQGPAGAYDLRRAREERGEGPLYTLQVGVYGDPSVRVLDPADRARARRAAEEASASLRRQGELAWHSHGPTLSSVTVGLFTEADLPGGVEGPAVSVLRERFPHNLLNGQGIRERSRGRERLQPSMLVEVPR